VPNPHVTFAAIRRMSDDAAPADGFAIAATQVGRTQFIGSAEKTCDRADIAAASLYDIRRRSLMGERSRPLNKASARA